VLAAMLLLAATLVPTVSPAQVAENAVSHQLHLILESAPIPLELKIGQEKIVGSEALPAFYAQRGYRAGWVGTLGLRNEARDLVDWLGKLPADGLDPESYHLDRLEVLLTLVAQERVEARVAELTELDLLLTDAFLMAGSHVVSGQIDPTTLEPTWIAVRREVDLVEKLNTALETGDVTGTLDSLFPDHEGYRRLRDLARRYTELVEAGGWEMIGQGPTLKPGDQDPRVGSVRRRLKASGDLAEDLVTAAPSLYDEDLEAALRGFQVRHGLESDGVLGPKTLAALNVSAESRLQQIYLNMERWRWLPQSLGGRYVLVNLPAFELQAVQDGELQLQMRVAVGRPYRSSPVFSDRIRYLVFNPYWEIPPRIAIKDKLPEIRKDPAYLEQQGIRVLTGWATDQQELDPASIDWSQLGPGNFPYRLRQDPGPLNALGRVKFMFPNRFDVYLHDTPTRAVFGRAERDVSSGCIRLEKPLELARLLLRGNEGWREGAIGDYLVDYSERVVRLDEPWSVHLLYWTAWVDADGMAEFRNDIYGRDGRLAKALKMPRPRSDSTDSLVGSP